MSRVILEKKIGICPDDMEARHLCGNGHLGCVNPNHLTWGTKTQNVRDSIEQGTKHYGDKKFTDEEILNMRYLLNIGEEHMKISETFGVSPSYLNKIRLNKVRK